MANEMKVLAKVPNVTLTVEECVSKKGNLYRVCCVNVNGQRIQLGFCGDREELMLLKAGVKIN